MRTGIKLFIGMLWFIILMFTWQQVGYFISTPSNYYLLIAFAIIIAFTLFTMAIYKIITCDNLKITKKPKESTNDQ